MKKQNKIQFTLLLVGFALIIVTYFYYPSLEKKEVLKSENLKKSLQTELDEKQDTAF